MTQLSEALDALLTERGVDRRPGDEGTVTPRCEHFGKCGGCHLQHLDYAEQLEVKTGMVTRAFESHGLDPSLVQPMLGADDPWTYRNKVDLTAKTFDGEVHLGFLPYGEKHTLIEFEECPIADPAVNRALAGIRRALPRHPEFKKKLISVVCRASRADQVVGLVFHGRHRDPEAYKDLGMDIMAEADGITGTVYVRKRKEHVCGDRALHEEIAGKRFRFPLRSFFQSNPLQTEALVAKVLEVAQPTADDVVLDLYGGVGLFGLVLADTVREVFILEDTPASAEAAKDNAERFGVDNVTVVRGQAEERVELMRRTGQNPTLVVVDPPRSGMHPKALEALSRFSTNPRLVYVSCNPETHARDCAALVEAGYTLEGVWPVDMFPQTLHIESVALLR